jgi:hypothetical protein
MIPVVPAGVIRGKIDRKALPTVSGLMLRGTGPEPAIDYLFIELSRDGTSYEARNIPPGKYQLNVNGERIRTSGDGFTEKALERHDVEVEAGETVVLDIGPK